MSEVYEPREDSYLISNFIRKYASDRIVLDMGCGNGILSFEAANYAEFVTGCDINSDAVSFCNNRKKGVVNVKFVVSDLFSNVSGKFDLIICNPPYLPFDSSEDESAKLWNCGGTEGWEFIEKFICEAKYHLTPDGKILLLFSSLTDKDKVESILEDNKFSFECLKEKGFFHEQLYVYLIS